MTVNALPPVGGSQPDGVSVSPRKTDGKATDSAFAALLAMFAMPAVAPVTQPDPASLVSAEGASAIEPGAQAPVPLQFPLMNVVQQQSQVTETQPVLTLPVPEDAPVLPQTQNPMEPVPEIEGSVAGAAMAANSSPDAMLVEEQPLAVAARAPLAPEPEDLPAESLNVAGQEVEQLEQVPVQVHSTLLAQQEPEDQTESDSSQPDQPAAAQPLSGAEAVTVFSRAELRESVPTPVRALESIPTPIEPARLVDEVAKFAAQAEPGEYVVTLNLHPEQLGEVKVQLHVTGREVHTVMEVGNTAAKQALENHGDSLRQGLDQAGLTLSGFNVSTSQGGQTQQDRRDLFEELRPGRRTGRVNQLDSGSPVTAAFPRAAGPSGRNSRLDTLA